MNRQEATARVDLVRRLLRLARFLDGTSDHREADMLRDAARIIRATVPDTAVTDHSPVELWDPREDYL